APPPARIAPRTLVAAAPLPFQHHVQAHREDEVMVGSRAGDGDAEVASRTHDALQRDDGVTELEAELIARAEPGGEAGGGLDTEGRRLGMVVHVHGARLQDAAPVVE